MVQATKAETTRGLEARLRALSTLKEMEQENMRACHEEMARLGAQTAAAEQSCRRLEQQIVEATNKIFVQTMLTPELISARRALIAKMQRSRSKKITVAKQEALQAEIKADRLDLYGLCTHPFVFSYDGYGGSHSYDYDDAYCGHRVCTVCNLREDSSSAREDSYATLEGGTHLVRRDLRKQEARESSEQEWFSPAFLKKLFRASAGSNNVIWPEIIDKKSVSKF